MFHFVRLQKKIQKNFYFCLKSNGNFCNSLVFQATANNLVQKAGFLKIGVLFCYRCRGGYVREFKALKHLDMRKNYLLKTEIWTGIFKFAKFETRQYFLILKNHDVESKCYIFIYRVPVMTHTMKLVSNLLSNIKYTRISPNIVSYNRNPLYLFLSNIEFSDKKLFLFHQNLSTKFISRTSNCRC
jgi:hypothetical protein